MKFERTRLWLGRQIDKYEARRDKNRTYDLWWVESSNTRVWGFVIRASRSEIITIHLGKVSLVLDPKKVKCSHVLEQGVGYRCTREKGHLGSHDYYGTRWAEVE